jgi:pimeloyl-ACP methyl ester carboxylesterase
MTVAFTVMLVGCAAAPETESGGAMAEVPEDRMVQLESVRLQYLDWGGEGDLILFVPGVTATAHVWNAVAPHFVDDYRVIAVTRREHGASEATGRPFDLDTLADDLAQVIEQFSEGPAIVVGHSYAGLELPRLYRRHPDKVQALVFVDALYGPPWDGQGPPGAPGFGPFDSVYQSLSEPVAWFREMYPGISPELASHYVESQLYPDSAGQLRLRVPVPSQRLDQFLSLKSTWSPSDYAGIDVPVLAIRAAQALYLAANLKARGFPQDSIDVAVRWAREVDDVQKRRTTEALLEGVPAAVSVVLDSTSHALPLDRSDVVTNLIREFLERNLLR